MNTLFNREEFGSVAVLRLRTTSIDATSAAAIAAACTRMCPITVLDFANVTFINSDGVSALLRFLADARESGHGLFALNVSPHHQHMFATLEMSRFMPVIHERDLASHRVRTN